MKKYVLCIALTPSTEFVVCLKKKKGPTHLIDKITFPGGSIEENESLEVAASREFEEETSVSIAPEAWRYLTSWGDETYNVAVMLASSDKILQAKTTEEEPVLLMWSPLALDSALIRPENYTAEFRTLLNKALTVAAPPKTQNGQKKRVDG